MTGNRGEGHVRFVGLCRQREQIRGCSARRAADRLPAWLLFAASPPTLPLILSCAETHSVALELGGMLAQEGQGALACPPLRIACHLLASGGRVRILSKGSGERADCFLSGVHQLAAPTSRPGNDVFSV